MCNNHSWLDALNEIHLKGAWISGVSVEHLKSMLLLDQDVDLV